MNISAFGYSQGFPSAAACPGSLTARNAAMSEPVALARRATRRVVNVFGGSKRHRSANRSTFAAAALTEKNPNMPPAPASACASSSKA